MITSQLGRAALDLARLVVPVECAGCSLPDVRLCQECAVAWWQPPLRVESGAPRLDIEGTARLPVWAVAALEGEVDQLVRAWKDGARRDLDRWLADSMRRAAQHIGPEVGRVPSLTVVPAPARAASTRRRGIDLPAVLASGAVAGLRDAGVDARCVRALRIGRGESRGGSARARWQSARATVRVVADVAGPVLVVDDVVTTGATLAACTEALERAGAMPVGALAAASVVSTRIPGAVGIR